MKKVYGEIYGEDAFKGVSVPFEMKYVLEFLVEQDENTIIDVFDSYEEYKEEEVEMSHYAKDGSDGTDDIDSVSEFKEWFFNEFDYLIEDGRISSVTIDFVNDLPELEINDVLTDEEARGVLENIIELVENRIDKTTDEQTFKTLKVVNDNLIIFRDKWFNQVV